MTASRVSVQLFAVREALKGDPAGTIRRLADIGYTQVEPFNFLRFDGLADALADNELVAPTTHVHVVGESVEYQDVVFSAARALGAGIVIDPHTDPERWQDGAVIAGVARQVNEAARVAARYGIRFGYHNHVHELANTIDGRTALEFFADRLDPEVVLEIDTYWAAVGGVDPAALLATLGSRVAAIHIKDGPGTTDKKDQVAVGSGSMPIRQIIEAAPSALRVIELDDSRGDRFEALADSLAFLRAEGLA